MIRILASLALLLAPISLLAGSQAANGLTEARTVAATKGEPILVLVWGEWNPLSADLRQRVWKSPSLTRGLAGFPVLTDVRLVQESSDEEQSEFKVLHGDNWSQGVGARLTVPAIYLYGEDGTWLWSLQGDELRALTTVEELGGVLSERLRLARHRDELLAAANAAQVASDGEAELAALVELIDLHFPRPEGLAERLRRVDPSDQSGWIARLEFPGWSLVKSAVDRANDGQISSVETELRDLSANPAYDDGQRAQIEAAWGSALRAAQRNSEAIPHLEQAARLDPDGPVGRSAARIAEMLRN